MACDGDTRWETWRVSAVAHPFPFRMLLPSAWRRFLFGETRVTRTHPPRPIPLNKEPQQCVDLIIPPSHGSHLKCLLYMDHPLFRSLLFICRGIDYNISNDIVILWSLPPPPGGDWEWLLNVSTTATEVIMFHNRTIEKRFNFCYWSYFTIQITFLGSLVNSE